MSGMTTTVLTGAEAFGTNQGYGLDRVYSLKREGAREPAAKIRVVIRHDNRGSQSSYRAEVWTPDGWKFVCALPSEETFELLPKYVCWRFDRATSPGVKGDRADCERAIEKIARQLLSDALKIIF